MTIGTTYQVSTGTLRITGVPRSKDQVFTLWYEAQRPEYSCEVQMTREHVKRIDNLMYQVK